MRVLLAVAVALLMPIQSATAANVWCGVVKSGIPDDYLNVRTGPSVDYTIIERIHPGDNVGVSAARCGLDTFGKTLCVGVTSDWVFVEQKFAGAPKSSGAVQYQGWVNGIYLSEVPCIP